MNRKYTENDFTCWPFFPLQIRTTMFFEMIYLYFSAYPCLFENYPLSTTYCFWLTAELFLVNILSWKQCDFFVCIPMHMQSSTTLPTYLTDFLTSKKFVRFSFRARYIYTFGSNAYINTSLCIYVFSSPKKKSRNYSWHNFNFILHNIAY